MSPKFSQDLLNRKYSENPKPGDYWHEMLVGQCVVVYVNKLNVIICQTKKDIPGEDKWTWDLEKLDILSRKDFANKFRDKYGHGYWARVEPKRHKWVLDTLKQGD